RFVCRSQELQRKIVWDLKNRSSSPSGHMVRWHIQRIDHAPDITSLIGHGRNKQASRLQHRTTVVYELRQPGDMLNDLKAADGIERPGIVLCNLFDARLMND